MSRTPLKIFYFHLDHYRWSVKSDSTEHWSEIYFFISWLSMTVSRVHFWTYIVILPPSVLCALFVLYHFLFDRTLRRALHNHVIGVVLLIGLICSLTIYPWMLYYYLLTGVWQRTPIFCDIWKFIDWGLYTTHTMVFAWATVEQHILIFHDRWVSTYNRRLLVHCFPLVALLMYSLVFYIVVIFFPPCQNFYFNVVMIWVITCYTRFRSLSVFDAMVHQIVPYLVIMLFSVSLFIRVIWQKYRFHQPVRWRQYRKMTVQSLSISVLYLVFFFPLTLYKILNFCSLSSSLLSGSFFANATLLSYLVVPLFPFVCLISLSELRKKVTRLFECRRGIRRIFPSTRWKQVNDLCWIEERFHSGKWKKEKRKTNTKTGQVSSIAHFVVRFTASSWFLINSRYFSALRDLLYSRWINSS